MAIKGVWKFGERNLSNKKLSERMEIINVGSSEHDGVCIVMKDNDEYDGIMAELKMLERIKDDLIGIIDSLETAQKTDYQPLRNLILSYLIDIRDGKVPEYFVERPFK